MTYAIINLLINIINLYLFVVIIWIISSWLISFGVIDPRHPVVSQILNVLNKLVEPVVAPIRRVIPVIAGFDFSPIVLFMALYFILDVLGSFLRTGNIL